MINNIFNLDETRSSDHLPLSFNFDINLFYLKQTFSERKILRWSITDDCLQKYEILTKTYLSDISFPPALKYTDAKCNSSLQK